MVFNKVRSPTGTQVLAARTAAALVTRQPERYRRVLPSVWIAADRLHDLLGRRKPFLTARRLLSNQTFRNLYHTDTLRIDRAAEDHQPHLPVHRSQKLNELYETALGDLAAFDPVRSPFACA